MIIVNLQMRSFSKHGSYCRILVALVIRFHPLSFADKKLLQQRRKRNKIVAIMSSLKRASKLIFVYLILESVSIFDPKIAISSWKCRFWKWSQKEDVQQTAPFRPSKWCSHVGWREKTWNRVRAPSWAKEGALFTVSSCFRRSAASVDCIWQESAFFQRIFWRGGDQQQLWGVPNPSRESLLLPRRWHDTSERATHRELGPKPRYDSTYFFNLR